MKYIQCARNPREQNAVVFQFGAEIYFQTFKPIKHGEEILVWYADYYEQYYGIPIGVRKLEKNKNSTSSGIHLPRVIEKLQNMSTSNITGVVVKRLNFIYLFQ